MAIVSTVTRDFTDAAGTITLDETARHRRRMKLTSDNGLEFLLDLPQARLLRHGDGLVLDDGRIVEVIAAPEELLDIRAGRPPSAGAGLADRQPTSRGPDRARSHSDPP